MFSVASIWEIAIKHAKGSPGFKAEPLSFREEVLSQGLLEMEIGGKHVVAVSGLPFIHKDPIDQLLIAQATIEGITLLTADATIARYPGPIRKV